ncbi:hypothetical protein [Sphingobacterium endophyticum]|uniref:hypothetical protein n=1 Tax=Sphingobacterium endophyticum TaxID=2546448 RepID=UPI0012E21CF8|nr:hypothetical protein [Sphingobacterium endophyticum]
MKFTLLNKKATFKTMFFIAVLLFTFQSCKKSDSDPSSGGKTTVNVKLSVGTPDEERLLVGNSKTTKRNTESNVQLSTVEVSDGISMDVMVIKDAEPSVLKSSYSSSEAKAATQTVTTSLEADVKYRIAVYDDNGLHKGNYDYAFGNEGVTGGIQLDAGSTYTFVVYSVNSKTNLPNISNQGTLSTASLNNISEDLMFFKKTMKLTPGDNNLNAVLVHQFSQITTTIEMDPSMTGSIESLTGTKISPTKSNGSLKFSNESLSFPNLNTSTNVTFPALIPGIRSITSEPTFIISPSTTSATFAISSIKLDGESKAISVPDIKITPGHKYNLVLKFRSCTQNVTTSGLNWNYPEVSWDEWVWGQGLVTFKGIKKDNKYYKNNEVITNTFSAPESDYGFVFDITDLDNAFNMRVNNQYIFGTSTNHQIQFQTNSRLGTERNIEFIDGTEYSLGGIAEVYNLQGTNAKPLIRIMISRNGEVTMLGSKTSGGELMQLRLKNNQSFKTVNWNKTGANSVVVSQKVDGRTIIIGTGHGRKRIKCPK